MGPKEKFLLSFGRLSFKMKKLKLSWNSDNKETVEKKVIKIQENRR